MSKNKRNVAASIRQKLKNQATQGERPFAELLQYYAMERFLYRLTQSSHADRFILKGALMLRVWQSPQFRPTMDIDMLDSPTPRLLCYSRESAIAEKFEAMIKLEMLNSRMKDFYDIWLLSRQFEFDGSELAEA
ncbi:MAG: nucleotidyl transferase AbiEii/AbiGii toxin family protein, partial [Gammaproteobacteria bacterium]|nr:nucleotidyl transferase AbiEii/AbiGii toxin family protein [Gammaproteobacteria bacterium]